MDWIQIIINLKQQKVNEQDYESASQFREIEKYLTFKHKIEEVFEVKNHYNSIVQKELVKLERKYKLKKLNNVSIITMGQ